MNWITFDSDKSGEELARYLAPFVFPNYPVDDGVPFLEPEGRWSELSRGNAHKLDLKGPGKFQYRDRYAPEERMLRIEYALSQFGVANIRRN